MTDVAGPESLHARSVRRDYRDIDFYRGDYDELAERIRDIDALLEFPEYDHA